MIEMDVKIFRVEGVITKSRHTMHFSKDVRALKAEDAAEKIYTDFGSQHHVKRVHIQIASVSEISPEEIKDTAVRELREA